MQPGEVFQIYSKIAGKQKYHLCISVSGGFLFLNSPKNTKYEGDLEIDCRELPFLAPTPSTKTVVSCSTIVQIPADELAKKAKLLGQAPKSVLLAIFEAVEDADYLSEEDREMVLGGLEDWI